MNAAYTIHDVSRCDRTILAARILAASGALRVELEDRLHAPLTERLTLEWLQARLESVTPTVLLGLIMALDAADELLTSSNDIDFDTDCDDEPDADGWDWLDRDDYAADADDGSTYSDYDDGAVYHLHLESTMPSSCTCGGGGAYGGGSAHPCGACGCPAPIQPRIQAARAERRIEAAPCPDCNGYGNADGRPSGTWDRDFGPGKPAACPACQGTGEAAVRGAILAVEALADFATLRRMGAA